MQVWGLANNFCFLVAEHFKYKRSLRNDREHNSKKMVWVEKRNNETLVIMNYEKQTFS